MASVYRKSTGVYYLAVTFQNSRITRSLGTRCYETAKRVTPQIEKQILSELISGVSDKKSKEISFIIFLLSLNTLRFFALYDIKKIL